MRHLTDGTLRRMYDEPMSLSEASRRHYAECAGCQARFESVAADAREAAAMLAGAGVQVDATAALARFRTAMPAAGPVVERRPARVLTLASRLRPNRSWARWVAPVAAIALLGLAAATFASQPFFQPQQIQTVPVDTNGLGTLPDLGAYGTEKWTTPPQPEFLQDAAAAQSLTGMAPPVVKTSTLPAGVSPSSVHYAGMKAASGTFTFSKATAQATVTKEGKTLPPLPAQLDGASLNVTAGPAVVEYYGDVLTAGGNGAAPTAADAKSNGIKLPSLVVAEVQAPVVTSNGITLKQFQQALLSMPDLTAAQKKAIQQISDPYLAGTLAIPIPQDYASSAQNVSVATTAGTFKGIFIGDSTGLGSILVWENSKTQVVYAVGGTITQDQAMNIAAGLS